MAEGEQEPALTHPPLLLNQDTLRDRDLPSRTAEGVQGHDETKPSWPPISAGRHVTLLRRPCCISRLADPPFAAEAQRCCPEDLNDVFTRHYAPRDGLRKLCKRITRWRFGLGWWVFILTASPVLTTASGLLSAGHSGQSTR